MPSLQSIESNTFFVANFVAKTMADDLYNILGVSKSATDDDIRKAYRKLAKKLHPDLNPDDEASAEEFKKISAAYAILGDKEQRAKYDAGEIDASGQERPEPRYYREHAGGDGGERYYYQSSGEDFGGFEDLSDIFGDIFGRGRRADSGSMRRAGRNTRYHLEIDFMDAAKGGKKRITLPDGASLDVSIPAGVEDGQTIRLRGKGEPGLNGGPAGDALIEISVRPDRLFRRDGKNIRLTLPIGLDEAVLGGKVEVPTIHGAVTMTIPAGASSGQSLRLKGRGVRKAKGAPGDQYVELKIVLPDEFDDDFKNAVKTWREKTKFDPRAGWAGR